MAVAPFGEHGPDLVPVNGLGDRCAAAPHQITDVLMANVVCAEHETAWAVGSRQPGSRCPGSRTPGCRPGPDWAGTCRPSRAARTLTPRSAQDGAPSGHRRSEQP